jgi:hypothetical protein
LQLLEQLLYIIGHFLEHKHLVCNKLLLVQVLLELELLELELLELELLVLV